jgi:fructose-bisphosphate aldolase class II
MTGAIRKVFAETPEKFDPRDYLKPAREAMKRVCIDRMTAFGQAGQATKVKPASVGKFANFYAAV